MHPRRLTRGLRALLWAASALVFLAGVPLFLGSEQTDLYFAWTIMPPLTAAFLGAAYWSSLVTAFLSARDASWARARLAVIAIAVVSTLMLAATLLHLDRFHLASPIFVAQGVAWAWLVVYLVIPLLMLAFLVWQLRVAGQDPARERPLQLAIRLVLGIQAMVMLPVGAMLFLAPQLTAPVWPWMLTPLTARAVGAWLVGLGTVAALGIRENDFNRAYYGFLSSLVLGILEIVALARYPNSVRWEDPATWVYVLILASILGMGAYGVAGRALQNRRNSEAIRVNPAGAD